MVIGPLSPTASTSTIPNVKQFPWYLRQEDHLLGCIPTSVAAVMTYYGEPHLLTERRILGILALTGKVSSICFDEVKARVLDRDSSFKAKFDSVVVVRTDFDQWTDYLVERVSKHLPPVIAYESSETTIHAGAVVGTHVVQPGHGCLLIHDPEKGQFDWMRLTRARSLFRPDILSISPLRPWPP